MCSTEGFVAGRSDSSERSDQALTRQNELTMSDATRKEMESDGEIVFESGNNKDPSSDQRIHYKNEYMELSESANQVSIEDQHNETSSTGVTDDIRKDEKKDVLLTNGQQNNENGIQSAAYLILPSRL